MKNNFSLEDKLQSAYSRFPEAEERPIIGLTANYEDIDATLRDRYYKQVIAAGGVPVIIPPIADANIIADTLQHLDGLILTGGADHNPLWYGEEPSPALHHINAERDEAELLTVRLAYNRQIPMLGICRGIQTLAIALDGHVVQDINSLSFLPGQASQSAERPSKEGKGVYRIKHSQDADRSEQTHSIRIEKDSELYNIYKKEDVKVNSFHHQAVDNPGKRFRATAWSSDDVIEAMESTEYKSIIGVQWHPEWLGEEGQKLFRWIVEKAKEYHNVNGIHSRILTLDTHCDTPMFFHEGVDFTTRDPRILVDLHKMTEGRQDATIMVAYLPQPKIGESFSSKVNFNVDSPFAYANLIFDKIEEIVKKEPRYLSISRTPAELYGDKRRGRKSIMLGIENGLALEHDIRNLTHFKQRGVVYITLCHNGDNDICDSARGCNTHNGVSQFGEKVIKEMNRLGIMVDLSHASESSFYDALAISGHPIVCSHSNCRALCDHPRNLTDDQLRAIAAKGGVVHTTFYGGFLRKVGEADIIDGIKHLEHAIAVMGIDHVGIGTDFDGDGGVCGMRDSSEIRQFTLQLLRRHYSEADIAKIWGGNWLRVMNEVQG